MYQRLLGGVAREGVDPWSSHEAGEEGRAPGDDRPILVAERLCRRGGGGGAVFRQSRARASVGTRGFDDHGRGGGAGDGSDVMSTLWCCSWRCTSSRPAGNSQGEGGADRVPHQCSNDDDSL